MFARFFSFVSHGYMLPFISLWMLAFLKHGRINCFSRFFMRCLVKNRRHKGSKNQDWVHQDFLVIEFQQDDPERAQGVLERLIGLNEIESLSHYSNESGVYRLVFRIEDAKVNLIPKIEGIIRASEAMNASVRLTQSAV